MSYDNWLVQPYEDYEEEAARAEWIATHTLYETECCNEEIDFEEVNFDEAGDPLPHECQVCGKLSDIRTTPPDTGE